MNIALGGFIKPKKQKKMNQAKFKNALEEAYNAGKSSVKREEEINKMADEGTKALPEMPSFKNWYEMKDANKEVAKKNEADVPDAFQEAARPLMKYLAEFHHPHMKVVVESDCAELLESQKAYRTIEFIVD